MTVDNVRLDEILNRERRLFQRVTDHLHRCRFIRPEDSRFTAGKIAALTLRALEQHAEIEQEVFDTVVGHWTREDMERQKILGSQHHQLKGLCKDVRTVSQYPKQYSKEHLCSLMLLLARMLSGHLEYEESDFWSKIVTEEKEFSGAVMSELTRLEGELAAL